MADKLNYDASTDILRGQLWLFIGGVPLAFCSSATLEISTDTIDASNKMTGNWNVAFPGKKSFTISTSSMITQKEGAVSAKTLADAQINDTLLDFTFGECVATDQTAWGGSFALDTTKPAYSGKVMVTQTSIKSEAGALATCDGSFTGVGALTPVAAVPAT